MPGLNQITIYVTDRELAALREAAGRDGYPTVDACVEDMVRDIANLPRPAVEILPTHDGIESFGRWAKSLRLNQLPRPAHVDHTPTQPPGTPRPTKGEQT